MFIHQGTAEQGQAFFSGLWSDATAVADDDGTLYEAFAIGRGGVRAMFGPQSIACGIRATAKGHFIGRPVGDPWTLPTLVLLEGDGSVLWRWEGRSAGERPDYDAITGYVR